MSDLLDQHAFEVVIGFFNLCALFVQAIMHGKLSDLKAHMHETFLTKEDFQAILQLLKDTKP